MSGGGSDAVQVRVKALLKPLVPRFLENRLDDARAFIELAGKGDFDALSRGGHSMKGTAGSFGFDRLAELAKQLEDRAEAGDAEGAGDVARAIVRHLEEIEVVYEE